MGDISGEAVAVLANMVASALIAGGVDGERDREDRRVASGAGGDCVSTPVFAQAQVRENFRSTERQYALAEEAARL
ncbi:MAG: hypothetical protein LC790_12625, partial [Actinobacteria bacterium]|nr:hypothetical protein [Actinomycetota bacterium]